MHGKSITEKSIDFGKRHWVSSVVALIFSSVIPLLEQWHADKQVDDTIAACETRLTNELAAQKADFNRALDAAKADSQRQIEALWRVVVTKQDKSNKPNTQPK